MRKRRFFDIIIAVAGALLLWLYVVTVVTPDDDIVIDNIRINFVGSNTLRTEHNLVMSNISDRTVTVKFHGSRVLLNQLRNEQNSIKVELDVSAFTSEKDYNSGYEVSLPTSLQDGQIQIVECIPKTVQFTVEPLASKQVAVKGLFDGTTAEGYVDEDLIFQPDTIKVSGPAALVEQVRNAQVLIGGKKLTSTTTKDVSVMLIDMNGEPLESDDLDYISDIQVKLPIFYEKTLEVVPNPIYGGGIADGNAVITVEPSSLVLRGDYATLSAMNSLPVELDFASILSKLGAEPLPPEMELTQDILLPEGLHTENYQIPQVTLKVSFRDVGEKTVEVFNVDILNLEDGMYVYDEELSVSVTLRGPVEELSMLDAEQIVVRADLSECNQPGTYTVPAEVSVGAGYLVPVGNYEITVYVESM